jgi:hypothetical protein
MLLLRYRYLGRFIDSSGFDNQYFPIDLITDGIDICPNTIVSISMSQPIKLMAPSAGNDDTIDDVCMGDP